MTDRERFGVAMAMAVLLAAGAWLRLAGLAEWHLSWDGMWHLMDAQQADLSTVLDRNLRHQIHGPLGYVLRYGLLGLTHDPFWLRSFSLLPGLLLIPVFYWLGREWLGAGAGLFLAAVAAVGYQIVVLSQVLRAYALLLLLLSLTVCLLLWWERTGQRRALIGYAISAAAAAWTHVSALIPLGVMAAVWTVRMARGKVRLRRPVVWLLGHALMLGPPAIWAYAQLYFSGGRSSDPGANLDRFVGHFWFLANYLPEGPLDALKRLTDSYRVFFLPPEAPSSARLWLGLPALLGIGLLARQRRWDVLAVCGGVVLAGVAAGLSGAYPFAPSRHCVYLIPFLLLPPAACAQLLWERVDGRWLALGAAVILTLGVAWSPGAYRRAEADFDTRRADLALVLDELAERAGPRDVVVINRVGMQYLNLEESLFHRQLDHVAHPADHYSYPYDRWVLPRGEEHRFRGLTFWACDGVHLWTLYLAQPGALGRCLTPLYEGDRAREVEEVWLLFEKRELALVFAAAEPGRELRRMPPAVRRILPSLLRTPFGTLLATGAVDRIHTPTAGALAFRWSDLRRALSRSPAERGAARRESRGAD